LRAVPREGWDYGTRDDDRTRTDSFHGRRCDLAMDALIMPKPGGLLPCPNVPAQRSSGQTTREYQISVVTPLFGGGVEAGIPDQTLPIRGTAIRGHLQFWWRATCGADVATREDLFARHGNVWGTTDRASPVEIDIRDVTAVQARPCARYNWNPQARQGQGGWRLDWESPLSNSSLPYALFPFQGKEPLTPQVGDPQKSPARFIQSASFTLRLRYPKELEQEIGIAVWAWTNFGGLGARTRRGCGALLCKDLAPKDRHDLVGWVGAGSTIPAGPPRDWPTLPSGVLVGSQSKTPVDAWKRTVDLLQQFRQGVGFARNPGQQNNRPGRSRYPEPETIRRVTRARSINHPRLPGIPDDAFPRAEFGLPVVFHFQGAGEPADTVLYPSNAMDGPRRERMASPLILKPLALANGASVPLIMRLVTPPLTGVDLRRDNQSLVLPAATAIRDRRLATYSNSPLSGATSGSALEAFLRHAGHNGFHEVMR
jgi:CRISPR-associated protein Cmr1